MSDSPLRVLVVEDDPDLRELLRLRFEMAGFGVRPAANGAEALEVMRSQAMSVAVVDLEMPVMSGQEAIPRLRAIDPALRIVVHTAGHEGGGLRGDARPDAVFRKGVPLAELVETVQLLGAESPTDEQSVDLPDIPLQQAVHAFDTWVGVNVRIRETVDEESLTQRGNVISVADMAALTLIFIDLGTQLAAAAQRHQATVQLRLHVQRAAAEGALRALDRIRSTGFDEFYAGWDYRPAPEAAAALRRMAEVLSEALSGA